MMILPIPDFERLKCLDASGLIAAGCIEMSLSFLKELVQSVYDSFALALKHGSFWSNGIIDRNCSPQSCRLLAIHYGDAQRLNHDAEDFDQWSGLVDLCQDGTAVITFSMIQIARSRVSIAPTRSIFSDTKISADVMRKELDAAPEPELVCSGLHK